MTLLSQGFSFKSFQASIALADEHAVILRHDVDLLPENSLVFARLQTEMGISGTYYFRILDKSFDYNIIKEIYALGHEVGYHYEDLGTKAQSLKGVKEEKNIVEIAIKSFAQNLNELRKIVPVNIISMHGSPLSKWDSRLLWKYYDYRDFGIIAEPYFDVDFNNKFYLTDTGRRWNGGVVSVRDKADGRGQKAEGKNVFENWKVKPVSGSLMNMTPQSLAFQNKYKFNSTYDIIQAAERGELPDKIMMTFHPQRWTDKPIPWVKELVWQNVKNVGKYFLLKVRS